MQFANRYLEPGHTDHITHRCHDQSFLFRFAKDRQAYRAMLREGEGIGAGRAKGPERGANEDGAIGLAFKNRYADTFAEPLFSSRKPLRITSSEAPISAAMAIQRVARLARARAMKMNFTTSAKPIF